MTLLYSYLFETISSVVWFPYRGFLPILNHLLQSVLETYDWTQPNDTDFTLVAVCVDEHGEASIRKGKHPTAMPLLPSLQHDNMICDAVLNQLTWEGTTI